MRKRVKNEDHHLYQQHQKEGFASEKLFEKWLEEGFIDRDFYVSEEKNWKQIDYISVKEKNKCRVYLELKGRNIDYDTFRTTMIGANKLKKARDYMKYISSFYLEVNVEKKKIYIFTMLNVRIKN